MTHFRKPQCILRDDDEIVEGLHQFLELMHPEAIPRILHIATVKTKGCREGFYEFAFAAEARKGFESHHITVRYGKRE